MKKMMIVFTLFLLTGCAAGKQLKRGNLLEVKKGDTTCSKVVNVFGTPTRMEDELREDEPKKLIYEYRETDPDVISYIPLFDLFGGYTLTTKTTTFVLNDEDIVSEINSEQSKEWLYNAERGGYMFVQVNSEDLSNQRICRQ